MKFVKMIFRLLIIFLIINAILAASVSGVSKNNDSYERGIFLKDHQTLLIENKVIHLDGDIIIKENAKLIIRNSTIIWKLTHFVSHVARIYDNGELIVENSILERSININANLWMEGENPSVTIINSKCTWDILAVHGKLDVVSSSIVGANGIFSLVSQGLKLLFKTHIFERYRSRFPAKKKMSG